MFFGYLLSQVIKLVAKSSSTLPYFFIEPRTIFFSVSHSNIGLFDSNLQISQGIFIKNVSTNKTSIFRTFTFCVNRTITLKPFFRSNPLVYFFEVNTFTLKNICITSTCLNPSHTHQEVKYNLFPFHQFQ